MMPRMRNPQHKDIRIAVTTGDTDGIGSEVACKALARLGPQPNVQFLLWRGPDSSQLEDKLLSSKFSLVRSADQADVWRLPFDKQQLIDIRSVHAPAQWAMTAAQACMTKLCDALVTGPLSKTGQAKAGFRHLGHTEMLANVSGRKSLNMGFIGEQFGVVLVTGHIPISRVKREFTAARLTQSIEYAFALRDLMPTAKRALPVAIVGLNPHAGERGLIGQEEISIIKPVMQNLRNKYKMMVGPLVPDAAFIAPMRDQYSVFVCPYHDQGLIPFKQVHGFDQGVHITMGLPFVRTSVDHGTAKDLFGKNIAKEGSMFDALKAAVKLVQSERGMK